MANQQPSFGVDSFIDSDDLMSWLLLNPEVDFEQQSLQQEQQQAFYPSMDMQSSLNNETEYYPHQPFQVNQANNSDGFDIKPYEDFLNSAHAFPTSSLAQLPVTSLSSSSYMASSSYTLNVQIKSDVAPLPPPRTKSEGNLSRNASKADLASATNISPRASHAGSKRPASSSVDSGSAKAKKKPRESIEDLEARVNSLKAENADLHAHLLNVTQRTTEVFKQRSAMERLMGSKLAELIDRPDGDQTELAHIVKQYTDIYADYGKCRQREVEFHLQQLEKLIVPTKTTKMSLWTMQQDKSFKKSPMFEILQKELDITPEQMDKIQERREKIAVLLGKLKESLDLLKNLREAISKKHDAFDAVCGRVQDAATPKQTVKFLMWINRNADSLAKYIPGFTRSQHYIPNHQFVEKHLRKSTSTKSLNGLVKSPSNSTLSSLAHYGAQQL